jgi:hypothetical protein
MTRNISATEAQFATIDAMAEAMHMNRSEFLCYLAERHALSMNMEWPERSVFVGNPNFHTKDNPSKQKNS